jgi:hypothetical protein
MRRGAAGQPTVGGAAPAGWVVLETGDVAIHNEEVYPPEALTRVGAGVAAPPPSPPPAVPEAAGKPEKVPSDSS